MSFIMFYFFYLYVLATVLMHFVSINSFNPQTKLFNKYYKPYFTDVETETQVMYLV